MGKLFKNTLEPEAAIVVIKEVLSLVGISSATRCENKKG
jgi:hypothetical protein